MFRTYFTGISFLVLLLPMRMFSGCSPRAMRVSCGSLANRMGTGPGPGSLSSISVSRSRVSIWMLGPSSAVSLGSVRSLSAVDGRHWSTNRKVDVFLAWMVHRIAAPKSGFLEAHPSRPV